MYQQVTTTYVSLRMQLDKKFAALETQLANLGPGKRVKANQVLKDENSHVCHGQVKSYSIMILHIIIIIIIILYYAKMAAQ